MIAQHRGEVKGLPAKKKIKTGAARAFGCLQSGETVIYYPKNAIQKAVTETHGASSGPKTTESAGNWVRPRRFGIGRARIPPELRR